VEGSQARPAWARNVRPYLNNSYKQKQEAGAWLKWESTAQQVRGPEFKPQYHKKKKRVLSLGLPVCRPEGIVYV
jgi:hypothetical protein